MEIAAAVFFASYVLVFVEALDNRQPPRTRSSRPRVKALEYVDRDRSDHRRQFLANVVRSLRHFRLGPGAPTHPASMRSPRVHASRLPRRRPAPLGGNSLST